MSAVRRYAVAALFTLVALSIASAGERIEAPPAIYSLFLAAVMVSSWICGLGPGILATVLGTFAADYFLIAPIHSVTFDTPRLVQVWTFMATAALISLLNESRGRRVNALAGENVQLEDRVASRTAELAAANETLRKEIEEHAQSERNFGGLIEAAPDAIVVIDSAGLITKVNRQAERMFGYTRDAMLGQDVEMIVPERFRAAHHEAREHYRESPAERTMAGDLTARRADGTEFPIEIRISPLETPGARSVVGIVRDVTERQRAHELRERLVHDLGERVKELTALHATGRLLNEPGTPAEVLGRIVALLPPAWQYPEITVARIAVGDIDVRTPDFEPTRWIQRASFETPHGDTGVVEVAYRQARPDAAEGPFLAEERSLIESLAAMLRAYFERRQVEEDRVSLARAVSARVQAQEANAAKDRFLATLSHELRSPLNVMLGWIQMLRDGQMRSDAAVRGFDVLDRSVRLQAKLIDDLLDVSRIVTGKLRIETQRVDLASIVAGAVEAARPVARARRVALDAAIAPALFVEADPQRLQQVVSNLLTNALKFTPEQGSIHVGVEGLPESIRLTVRDTGIGIEPELLPRVFDRLQQGDASTTRTHGGLGLGLAIVKHLVERHGGRIDVTSGGRGCGATFTMTMPRVTPQGAAVAPAAAACDPSLLAGVRVLIVDDEADARATLTTVLEQFGAQPIAVASARAARDAVSTHRPDVLLSDVVMPEEDGYTLIRRIRAMVDAADLPAAALTARVAGDGEAEALDAGYQAYLTKPIDPVSLAATLASLVHRTAGS